MQLSLYLLQKLANFLRAAQIEPGLARLPRADAYRDPMAQRRKRGFVRRVITEVDGQRRGRHLAREPTHRSTLPFKLLRNHLPDLVAAEDAQIRLEGLHNLAHNGAGFASSARCRATMMNGKNGPFFFDPDAREARQAILEPSLGPG